MSAPTCPSTDEYTWPPRLTIAGIAIDVDRIDDEPRTVWLYDDTGRRIVEVLNVSRIKIGAEG